MEWGYFDSWGCYDKKFITIKLNLYGFSTHRLETFLRLVDLVSSSWDVFDQREKVTMIIKFQYHLKKNKCLVSQKVKKN